MFVTSDFACFDLQSTSDFSLIRRSISEKSKQAQMILPQGFSTIFGAFSLSGLAFPAGSTDLQNDFASVMVRCDRKTQNLLSARTCGVDPRHRHHPESFGFTVLSGFLQLLKRRRNRAVPCLYILQAARTKKVSEFCENILTRGAFCDILCRLNSSGRAFSSVG